MNQILLLTLNASEFISFEIGYPFHGMRVWDDSAIYFKGTDCYLIGAFNTDINLGNLIGLMEKALINDLKLYPSIKKDIGYLWNEDVDSVVNNISNAELEYRMIEKRQYWVGQDFLLWSTPGNARPELTTWLYNDEQGEIVMEVTPNYPWHFMDPTPEEKFITYDAFIKDYKPLLKRTIPREVAQQWIKQADQLLKLLLPL